MATPRRHPTDASAEAAIAAPLYQVVHSSCARIVAGLALRPRRTVGLHSFRRARRALIEPEGTITVEPVTTAARSTEATLGRRLEGLGTILLRYGLVVILLWVGLLKFTTYEAEAIQVFVENSPLLSWLYDVVSVRTFSTLLGIFEIVLALMIATRPFAPKVSAVGSLGALVLFLVTLTLVFSTPGAWQPDYGFPYLSPDPGQFLAKDVALVAIALWTAGEALRASQESRDHRRDETAIRS